MPATYINDLTNTSYPFKPGQQITFADALITDLHVSIVYDSSVYSNVLIYVAAIRVTNSSVNAALVAEYTVNAVRKTRYVGEVACEFVSKKSIYTPAADDIFESFAISYTGFDVPQNVGVYEGPFYIEPGCVSATERSDNQKYTDIYINGKSIKRNGTLKIQTTGRLHFEKTSEPEESAVYRVYATARETNIAVDIAEVSTVQTAAGITSIGGISSVKSGGQQGVSLYITTDSNAAIELTASTISSTLIVVELDGGTGFPHCYGAEDHVDTV